MARVAAKVGNRSKPEQKTEPKKRRKEAPAAVVAAEPEQPRKRARPVYSRRSTGLPEIPALFTEEGRVYVCGQGDSGQLGLSNLGGNGDDGSDDDEFLEVKVPRLSELRPGLRARQVAAGGMHSVALAANGEVYTAGVNDEAALGRKTDARIWEQRALPGTASDAAAWGKVEIPATHGDIIMVTAGDSHTMALTSIGAIWGWGCFRGDSGAFGFSPSADFALLPALVYRPSNAAEQVLSIASGADHVLAVRRDGSVLSWGYGKQGQLGRLGARMTNAERDMLLPAAVPLHNIKGFGRKRFKAAAVAAGSYGSFVLSESGNVVSFGVNASGQLGHAVQGATVDSNILQRPAAVTALAAGGGVAAIGAGKAHSLALQSDGRLLSFGLQTYGRLGRKDADVRSDAALTPGPVDGLEDVAVAAVSGGHDTSAIVTEQGEAFLWGLGTNYQLGKAGDSDDPLPRKLRLDRIEGNPKQVLQVSFGGQHTLLLLQ